MATAGMPTHQIPWVHDGRPAATISAAKIPEEEEEEKERQNAATEYTGVSLLATRTLDQGLPLLALRHGLTEVFITATLAPESP